MSFDRASQLISEILADVDNLPTLRKIQFNTQSKQRPQPPQQKNNNNNNASNGKAQTQTQAQPKRKLSKKEKKMQKKLKFQRKQQLLQSKKQNQNSGKKRKKRGSKLKIKSELPLPTLINGVKSTLLQPMQATYDPIQVEALWDKWWEEQGYYAPALKDRTREKFVMMIPPPNVTGSLHLGHALMATIEDCITRYWRMKGKNCLWLPGTDHAGIATQTVVERKIANESNGTVTKHDLGREKFLAQIWQWKEEKGGKICEQLRRMGCSVDWSREVFTMDAKLNKAVTEAFVIMYHEKKLIYRENRLCHWSCALQSAIADCEVDKIELEQPTFLSVPGYPKRIEFGIIHQFAYTVVGSDTGTETETESAEQIIVATTRLETMLGDTAVAVHPKDPRYTHLHGKFVRHPFFPDRKMPIICDDVLVDMAFGTGAVKITPAHDANDFECGKRHGLAYINILTDEGCINEHGGAFAGMKRYDCRKRLVKELTALHLFHGKSANPMVIEMCSRSKDVIEPMMKLQWYVDCRDLAAQSLEAVANGSLKLYPKKEAEHQWQYFLGSIRPWCISRQLWWGHRIPAWKIHGADIRWSTNTTTDAGNHNGSADDAEFKTGVESTVEEHWIIARNEAEAQAILQRDYIEKYGYDADAHGLTLEQDEDVLDTWFSSGLFPFSTMGWPDTSSVDLQEFFPGHLLETGGDILFFWVARMVMMSLCLMDGQLPFTEVYLHPMVRDEDGAKMSKTKGNVIDPLHIINGVSLQTLICELEEGNLNPKEIAPAIKMKTKRFANGIPPCGADGLRYGLLAYLQQGRSINLSVQRVVGYRLFCNKMWNAHKLFLQLVDAYQQSYSPAQKQKESENEMTSATVLAFVPPEVTEYANILSLANNESQLFCNEWILSRLNECILVCEASNPIYEYGVATAAVYQFFLHEFCDYYLELIKPIVYHDSNQNNNNNNNNTATVAAAVAPTHVSTEEQQRAQYLSCLQVLFVCLDVSYKLMHPYMPFLTEELWQRLRFDGKHAMTTSIMIASYPTPISEWINRDTYPDFDLLSDISKFIRSIKQNELKLSTKTFYDIMIEVLFEKDDEEAAPAPAQEEKAQAQAAQQQSQNMKDKLNALKSDIMTLSYINGITILEETVDGNNNSNHPASHYYIRDLRLNGIPISLRFYCDVGPLVDWKQCITKYEKRAIWLQSTIEELENRIPYVKQQSEKKKMVEKLIDTQKNLTENAHILQQLIGLQNTNPGTNK